MVRDVSKILQLWVIKNHDTNDNKMFACEIRWPLNLANLFVERKAEPDVVGSQAKVPNEEGDTADRDWGDDLEVSTEETSDGLQEAAAISRIEIVHDEYFEDWKQSGQIGSQNSGDESQRKNKEKVLDSNFTHRSSSVGEIENWKSFDSSIRKKMSKCSNKIVKDYFWEIFLVVKHK